MNYDNPNGIEYEVIKGRYGHEPLFTKVLCLIRRKLFITHPFFDWYLPLLNHQQATETDQSQQKQIPYNLNWLESTPKKGVN